VPYLASEAASRCGINLPKAPDTDLLDTWQMRVRWIGLGSPTHAGPAGPDASALPGRACLTAYPVAEGPVDGPPLYRDELDEPLRRRRSTRQAPADLPARLRAFLAGSDPPAPPEDSKERQDYLYRQQDLIAQHLAVRQPPTGLGDWHRIAVHPDIPFALRLTRPAPLDPRSTGSSEVG